MTELETEIIKLFDSDLSIREIKCSLHVKYYTITDLWKKHFGQEAFDKRKRARYAASKSGTKNPMYGKFKALHHGWKEAISDRRGYSRVRCPDWYTGKRYTYLDEHIVNYCVSRGLTEIPQGMEIHHLDHNKKNNDPKNLIMLSKADHTLLHGWINRVIVQRLSREGVD